MKAMEWVMSVIDGTGNPFDPDDYGNGFKARELINGKWVMMKGDQICSLVYPGAIVENPTGVPGSSGDRSVIDDRSKNIMAAFGVMKPRK